MSVKSGAGEFLVIVDLTGLSWNTCPPFKVMSKIIGLLKRHFPYRLHAMYIVNVGFIFDAVWKLIKPLMPPRALKKTFFLNHNAMSKILVDKVGVENLEISLGGLREAPNFNDEVIWENYFSFK